MIDRVKLGWRVNQSVWDAFKDHVAEKHGATQEYLRFEMELAIREFLDEDDILAEAEDLLDEYTDLQSLSSSTESASINTDRFRGETTLVQNRVNAELKERFQIFADKHDAAYGRLMSRALDTYVDGGRARRILDDVHRAITGESTVEAQSATEENPQSPPRGVEAQTGAEESPGEHVLSSDDRGASSADANGDDVDIVPEHVLGILDHTRVPTPDTNSLIPEAVLDDAIAEVVGETSDAVYEAYLDAVLEQLNATEHPHKPEFYVTEVFREENPIYADMDRDEREIALRRFLAADAVDKGELTRRYTYTEVQEVFEEYAGGGSPSHQYTYDLMEAVAEAPGFNYGKFHDQTEVRVSLAEVSPSVREHVRENAKHSERLDELDFDTRIEDWDAGSPPDQETAADD